MIYIIWWTYDLVDQNANVNTVSGGILGHGETATSESGGRLFSISHVAELTGVGVRSLRQYEARGLVTPVRSEGGTRRFSRADIARLRRVRELVDVGANLASIGIILDLQDENTSLRYELRRMQ